MIDDPVNLIVSVFGPEHPASAAGEPFAFCDLIGAFHEHERRAIVAAIEDEPPGEWTAIVRAMGVPPPPVVMVPPAGAPVSRSHLAHVPGVMPPAEAIAAVVRATHWRVRCGILLGLLKEQDHLLRAERDFQLRDAMLVTLIAQWTIALEFVRPEPIGSIQAATCLLASAHDEWAASAVEWLAPMRATWWPRWLAEHPELGQLLRYKTAHGAKVPSWVLGATNA